VAPPRDGDGVSPSRGVPQPPPASSKDAASAAVVMNRKAAHAHGVARACGPECALPQLRPPRAARSSLAFRLHGHMQQS